MRSSRILAIGIAALTLGLAAAITGAGTPAKAASSVRYVSLGDSYSSGVGAGSESGLASIAHECGWIPRSRRGQEKSSGACGTQADSGFGSAMQWHEQTGARRHDFQITRGEAGQRSWCTCGDREWMPSSRDYIGNAAQDRNIFSAGGRKKIMATSVTNAASTREKLLRARGAAAKLATLSSGEKNALLLAMAGAIEANVDGILTANREDVESSGLDGAMRDRLLLTTERIEEMAQGVRDVAVLRDPVGETLAEWTRPNGLQIRKVRVPLGVVGIIYESRPNVTVDTAVLALKTGNAIVLRGGKEAARSNQRLVEILTSVPGVPEGAIELLDSNTRESVQDLIKARGLVDVIIPRGGAGLIAFVTENSSVPVIETGAGNCHIFVDESADFDMADRIVINAKTSRPSVCNAAEKLLIHEKIAEQYVPRIVKKLIDAGVEVRGDEKSRCLVAGLKIALASEEDWYEEYLRLCMGVRVVANVDVAIDLINRYSTKHSDSIVTRDEKNARKFLRSVDSAAVYWNASTRFTDGAEFGFGAEMGISTQKLHCRGPFALAELTSSKYEIVGTGQVR